MSEQHSSKTLAEIKSGYRVAVVENPTFKHLIKQIQLLHDLSVRKAQGSTTQEEGFGHLKESSGIIKVLEHIQTYSGIDVLPDLSRKE